MWLIRRITWLSTSCGNGMIGCPCYHREDKHTFTTRGGSSSTKVTKWPVLLEMQRMFPHTVHTTRDSRRPGSAWYHPTCCRIVGSRRGSARISSTHRVYVDVSFRHARLKLCWLIAAALGQFKTISRMPGTKHQCVGPGLLIASASVYIVPLHPSSLPTTEYHHFSDHNAPSAYK